MPRGGLCQAQQQTEDRCLAGAVRPDKRRELALVYVEGYIVQDGGGSIGERDSVEADGDGPYVGSRGPGLFGG